MLGLKRFWIQITADRKRFGLLCVMLAFGLLLWMRMILISDHPRTAIANDPIPAGQSGQTRPSDKRMRQAVVVALPSEPGRDPFIISEAHFPLPETRIGFVQDPDKSGIQQVEDPEQAEARLRVRLQELVSQFRLEAVMHSLVLINGQRYRLHDEIRAVDGSEVVFRIMEIRDRSVAVEHEGRVFELTMKSPDTG